MGLAHDDINPFSLLLYLASRLIALPRFPGFSGLGLVLMGNAPVTISEVDEGGPADIAGVKSGDLLLEINEHPCVTLMQSGLVTILQTGTVV